MKTKFNEFINEGLLDKMKPKSDEDIKKSVSEYIDKIQKMDEDELYDKEKDIIIDLLDNVMMLYDIKSSKDLIGLLIDNKILNPDDIIDNMIEELTYDLPYEVDNLIKILKKKIKE